jgi:hypothetical protein
MWALHRNLTVDAVAARKSFARTRSLLGYITVMK